MSDGTLFTGKSVEDAVAEGLRSLGLTEQQVEIVVLNRGSRGLFGLGSEPAQVRIVPRSQSASAPVVAIPSRQPPHRLCNRPYLLRNRPHPLYNRPLRSLLPKNWSRPPPNLYNRKQPLRKRLPLLKRRLLSRIPLSQPWK
ncbi:MAG: Jag N-terminal domain-containing protein [Anaerolineales bacterium]|nr:Jag N-terminal domain-containing protein [Anaerolineales bacterium]